MRSTLSSHTVTTKKCKQIEGNPMRLHDVMDAALVDLIFGGGWRWNGRDSSLNSERIHENAG
jgi:hypothetical protein